MSESPLGVFIATSTPPEEIGPNARLAEDLGFSEVWVAEDYFAYGGFTGSGAALAATSEVKVGLGIAAAVARHPAVTAMEIANLGRIYPGRFIPGIGHGVPVWTDQMGLTAKSPLSALRECVTSIRALLSGDTVTAEGKQFTFNDVTLAHPPEVIPDIVTGVLGPKSLQLSGQHADGTVMSVLAGTDYLRSAVKDIKLGMDKAGSSKPHLVPTFALFNIGTDGAAAKEAVRLPLAAYLSAVGPHNPLSGAFGYNEELAELLPLGVEELARRLPAEWIDSLAVAGNPEQVTARVSELLAAGATSVVLSPVVPSTASDCLTLAAKEVLPAFN